MVSPERSKKAMKKGYGRETGARFHVGGENRCQKQAICKESWKTGQSGWGHTTSSTREAHVHGEEGLWGDLVCAGRNRRCRFESRACERGSG